MSSDRRPTLVPTSREIFGADPAVLTEAGAAEKFAREHGDDVRFDHRRGRWLLWGGHRWVPDEDGAIMRIALEFVRGWQRESPEIADRTLRENTFTFAIRLERRDAMLSLLKLASNLHPITTTGANWDADPLLLCCPNGVVDLRTATLRPGAREDGLTLQTRALFDPSATCPRWEKFLREVFAGDEELITFVRRAIGYSITGLTLEQCLLVLYGSGSNGKGSLTNTLLHVLGDYGHVLPFSTLELNRGSSIPNDLAGLVSRRFVTASETNDGARLNESRIKMLTGCDPVPARFLHREWFTFQPVGKYWLSVNHRPIVRDDSFGFWRRIRLIPFTQSFAVNASLPDELQREAPGILAWCVRGCTEWLTYQLPSPASVTTATQDYERESDALAPFIEEAIDVDPDAEVRASELYQHYRTWADRHGLTDRERLTATAFGRKVGERGVPAKRTASGKVYTGIARRSVTSFS